MTADDRPQDIPHSIGPYRILERIGEGGMGTVYRAERRAPVRQTVALKLVREGLATREVLARFELERRALAAMNHRCIAKVLDAGATDKGEPFFVMELVEGLPITRYCDKHKLGVPERLRLFRQVCQAVQHAHQKGVVHRDLKPGNVLVVREGDEAVPKVLDFGLAKATNRDFLEATVFTERDQLLGTLEYMSPEQAAGDGEVIDARSDIYSLGVLLYELLAGELPFPTPVLKKAGKLEALRMIREVDPQRPSVRLAAQKGYSEDVASHRRTTSQVLLRALRGDLDWVVMRALEKEPERRYDSATTLALELERYLRCEPVMAGPPSAGYRLRKFLRRHRAQVAAAAVVLLAIVLGGTASAVLAVRNEKLADDYRTLLLDARLDLLESRAALAHPAGPETVGELEDLVAIGRELVAQVPALERLLDELRRGRAVASADSAAIERGEHVLAPHIAELEREILRLEGGVRSDGIAAADRQRVREEIGVLGERLAGWRAGVARWESTILPDAESQLFHDRIDALYWRLRLVADELLPDLEFRLDVAQRIEPETVEDHAELWRDTLQAIREEPRYEGLVPFGAQIGLVPLGPDPDSRLHEFALPLSGTVPTRGADRRLRLEIDSALVFVLLPPGQVRLGYTQHVPPDEADDYLETPVDGFLLSKFEMSRAQWMRLAHGVHGIRLREGVNDVRNRSGDQRAKPANGVTWTMCDRLLQRYGLRLPTEREWEYACKAGTTTTFHTGDDLESLARAANLGFLPGGAPFPDQIGRSLAPVFHPLVANDFGLLHMHGNVREWCADVAYGAMPGLRAIRGGGWLDDPERAASVYHDRTSEQDAARDTGLRPARTVSR